MRFRVHCSQNNYSLCFVLGVISNAEEPRISGVATSGVRLKIFQHAHVVKVFYGFVQFSQYSFV